MSKLQVIEDGGKLYPKTKAEYVDGLSSMGRPFSPIMCNFGSHRGFCSDFPENTMPAFIAAVDRGYRLIETDLVQSSDGIQFCLHDATINRTSNGSGTAHNLTAAQLRSYDFGYPSKFGNKFQGTKIPSLEELLIFCKRKDVFVELDIADNTRYSDSYLQVTYDMVKRYNMLDRVFFCAGQSRLNALKAIDPSVMMSVSLMSNSSTSAMDSAMSTISGSRMANFSIPYLSITDEKISYAHGLGVSVKTWYNEGDGNDTEAHADALFNRGVETILSDFVVPNNFLF